MALIKVGCKLPHGLILELGYRLEKISGNIIKDDTYRRIVLNGTNSNLIQGAPAQRVQAPGITFVDESDFDAWMKKNNALGFVKAGMIYKIASEAEGQAIALDLGSQKTGFEPLDSKAMPKGVSVETDAGGGGSAGSLKA